MKLVASVITKNELDRYLPLAVDHLLTFCDEVRVLDDGSTDGTFEWLGGLNKPVFVKRNPGPAFYEYESKARQNLLEWTMRAKPDYVLSIDADEFVGDPEIVRRAVDRGLPVFTLDMEEVWRVDEQSMHLRIDGHWGPRLCPILWRAPSELSSEWAIPDRKLACGREPAVVRRTRFKRTGTSVFHFGWTNEAQRIARAERYAIHDQGKFHRDQHLQSILWPDGKVRMNTRPWPRGLTSIREQLIEVSTRR